MRLAPAPGARFEPGDRLVRGLGSGSRKIAPRRLIGRAHPPEGRHGYRHSFAPQNRIRRGFSRRPRDDSGGGGSSGSAPIPAVPPAVTQPLPAPRILTQATALAPLQQLARLPYRIRRGLPDDRRGALCTRLRDSWRTAQRHPQRGTGARRRGPSPADLRANRVGGRSRSGRLRRGICELPAISLRIW